MDLSHLAHLAHLDLDPKHLPALQHHMDRILAAIHVLQDFDPEPHTHPHTATLRDDHVTPSAAPPLPHTGPRGVEIPSVLESS